MYKNDLAVVFENTLARYSVASVDDLKEHLMKAVDEKKYDLQDQGIIEAILEDPEKILETSFSENLQLYFEDLESEHDLAHYVRSDNAKNQIVEIFISDLDQLINYFYNGLINKHFS